MILKVPSNPYCMILWFYVFMRMYHQVIDRGATPLGWKVKNPKKDTTKHKSYLETGCLNPTFSDNLPWIHQSQSCSDSTSVIARWCSSVCLSVDFCHSHCSCTCWCSIRILENFSFCLLNFGKEPQRPPRKEECLFWDCFNLLCIEYCLETKPQIQNPINFGKKAKISIYIQVLWFGSILISYFLEQKTWLLSLPSGKWVLCPW